MMLRIRELVAERAGVDLKLSSLFAHPTIGGLAALLDDQREDGVDALRAGEDMQRVPVTGERDLLDLRRSRLAGQSPSDGAQDRIERAIEERTL